MTVYDNKYAAYISPTFRGRVMFAIRKVANDVWEESPTVEFYNSRRALAEMGLLLKHPDQAMNVEFLLRILDNATIVSSLNASGVSSAPDTDFEFVISSEWNEAADTIAKWNVR